MTHYYSPNYIHIAPTSFALVFIQTRNIPPPLYLIISFLSLSICLSTSLSLSLFLFLSLYLSVYLSPPLLFSSGIYQGNCHHNAAHLILLFFSFPSVRRKISPSIVIVLQQRPTYFASPLPFPLLLKLRSKLSIFLFSLHFVCLGVSILMCSLFFLLLI